jgi:hypothetical protein
MQGPRIGLIIGRRCYSRARATFPMSAASSR